LSACNVSRSIPENEYLLSKNKIKTDKSGFTESINSIIKQKPNRRILGVFRFHLGVYNLANKGKENGFKRWLKNAVGEQPVLLDTGLTRKSREQILIFMQNNGYFNAQVSDSTHYHKHQASVSYHIHSGAPYLFRNVRYEIPDSQVAKLVLADTANCRVKSGSIYSSGQLQKERERISANLRKKGYYFFNPLYISFLVDSSLQSNQVDVRVLLKNPLSESKDTLAQQDSQQVHRRNYIQEVIVEMDYDPLSAGDQDKTDTTEFEGLKMIASYPVELQYVPRHISEHIFIRRDSIYSQADVDLTYRRLSDLGIFRFVNIRFEYGTIRNDYDKEVVPLRCFILLAPQPRQEFKLEVEGTNNGGNFGVAGNIVYRNKNIFKGAETFTFRLKGGLEIQQNFGDTTYESIRQLGFFNAYELGPEVSINFPRALWPFRSTNKRVDNPTSSLSMGYNQQNRPEYFRQLVNLSYYFTKRLSRFSRLYLYPAEINYLNVTLDPAFIQQLLELQDFNIIFGYVDQFISNGRISYVFNNQDLNVRSEHFYFRANLEFAGNSLYLAKRIGGQRPRASQPLEVFNVKFAQYIRPDIDLRFYKPLSLSNSTLAARIATGLGFTYGNSNSLPFEKSFFAGGPIDIRAWRTRQLGPGANRKDDIFERFGDIKIISSLEYRFDIYKKIKGALFTDAGNIWLLRFSQFRPEGYFRAQTFLNQVAVGSGLGLRFDLSFFIIRLDGAIQMRDPAQPVGERWVLRAKKFSDVTYNFAIGYPF
jgi:outer membrane protein assembly factor BamA